MQLTTVAVDDTLVIRVNETRIDAASAIQFKDGMRKLTQDNATGVILDLSQVTFIDSSGLGAIVAVRKQLGEARQMALASLQPAVQKVFRLTHLDKVFNIYDSAPVTVGNTAE